MLTQGVDSYGFADGKISPRAFQRVSYFSAVFLRLSCLWEREFYVSNGRVRTRPFFRESSSVWRGE